MSACANCLDSARPRSTKSISRRFFSVWGAEATVLGARQDEEFRELAQSPSSLQIRSQLADGARGQVTGHLAGLLDAVQRRIGCFPSCLVFARGFSERGRGLFDIEYVVHNLEGPADVFAK